MTIRDFIDKRVRPSIGDTLKPTGSNQPQQYQDPKYDAEVLLDYLNEGVLDIAENSSLFVKNGYALISSKDKVLFTPSDFKGFYGTYDVSAGIGTDYNSAMPSVHIQPTRDGIRIIQTPDPSIIGRYMTKVAGIVDTDIVNKLIEAGYLSYIAGASPIAYSDAFKDRLLIEYQYRYLPPEFTLDDTITDRTLMYLLRWWTAAHALYGDMHNEAQNLAQIYEIKYKHRLEKAGQPNHKMNAISLSPYSPTRGY